LPAEHAREAASVHLDDGRRTDVVEPENNVTELAEESLADP
jgi:hypothetical protein